ncbi:hypothetical protein I7I53_04842 [Histoplasma capsulatum var. duboisii H88]|uniref:Uncharacterized protein n=1 Tax=Ajellomyces capsulatus (strain H88) TaxID=544711 RepID=A0A8A1LW03_AJEC8|nr:hypothetical protein I7I53_04842 [Histoplasma capsulatum var. duboisii H88]
MLQLQALSAWIMDQSSRTSFIIQNYIFVTSAGFVTHISLTLAQSLRGLELCETLLFFPLFCIPPSGSRLWYLPTDNFCF